MERFTFNGVPCKVLVSRGNGKRGNTARTVHTLSHYFRVKGVKYVANTCPFDDSVKLHDEQCVHCANRLRLPYLEERETDTIECMAFDVRKRRHTGDALDYEEPIIIYPNEKT